MFSFLIAFVKAIKCCCFFILYSFIRKLSCKLCCLNYFNCSLLYYLQNIFIKSLKASVDFFTAPSHQHFLWKYRFIFSCLSVCNCHLNLILHGKPQTNYTWKSVPNTPWKILSVYLEMCYEHFGYSS